MHEPEKSRSGTISVLFRTMKANTQSNSSEPVGIRRGDVGARSRCGGHGLLVFTGLQIT